MFAIGDSVTVQPPFGNGSTVLTVVDIQHVADDGSIVSTPSSKQQYVLSDGLAYASIHLAPVGV